MEQKREIKVSVEWFEQFEGYLQADERFMPNDMFPALILVTPTGKKLIFHSHDVIR